MLAAVLFLAVALHLPAAAAAPARPTAAVATSVDADLAARAELAAVPGVRFTFLVAPTATEAAAPGATQDAVQPPVCSGLAAGLCDIHWGSAPPVLPIVAADAANAADGPLRGAEILLRSERGAPLLGVRPGEVVVALDVSAADSPSSAGGRLRRWPYFNYLLYVAACRAASPSQPPPRFGDWAHAPLPGPRGRGLTLLAGAGLWLLALLGLRRARRKTLASDEATAAFLRALRAPDPASRDGDAGASGPAGPAGSWSKAGFARPLSGLLTLVGAMVLLIGPYFALQSFLSSRVQPFPEAGGLWSNTVDALFLAWLTFDLGTQTAMVKYFAEHRAAAPEEALRDVQFYVWWQLGARLVEATFLLALALGYLPASSYALYTPLVLLYAAGCPLSFGVLPKLVCQALQRFDYQNLLDLLEARVLAFVVPVPFVLLGRAWGRAHPSFGEAYGAALGLGLGQMFTQLVVFSVGLVVLRRLRIPLRPLFLAHFSAQTAKRQLWFGLKLTIGQEPFRLTSFLENLIVVRWLRDFPSWLGIRDLLHNRLTFLFFFAWGYYQSAVPAVAEALAAARRRLVQYYVARYLQFGFLYSALMFSLLCAIGPRYIAVALGVQWLRAADYLILASVSGLLLPLAWLSDSLQQGAGRPGLTTAVMLIEQGLRLLLLLLLVPRWQFTSLYIALLVALTLKCCIGFALNHRYIARLTLPLWTTVGAPLAAGLLNFLVWRGLVLLVDPRHTATVLALFFVAGAGSFALGLFLCGLVGGFDADARRELDDAARMSAVVRPVCHLLAAAAQLGARLAPFPAAAHPLAAAAHEPEVPPESLHPEAGAGTR
ncbi:MAG: polysaccharide biosynthesis C-terminal domain-containing protein [Polyangia bacterium]